MRYPDQPKHTCPDIDAFKKKIATYLRDYPDDIKGNLETIHDFCEDMRYKNSGIRDWGSALEEYFEACLRDKDKEIESLNGGIDDMNRTIMEMQEKIDELYQELWEKENK